MLLVLLWDEPHSSPLLLLRKALKRVTWFFSRQQMMAQLGRSVSKALSRIFSPFLAVQKSTWLLALELGKGTLVIL